MLGMMDDEQRVSISREVCMQSGLIQPENVNDVSTETKKTSSPCAGDEEAEKRGAKREHAAIAGTTDVDAKLSSVVQCTDGDIEKKVSVALKEDEAIDECIIAKDKEENAADEGPPRKLSRLAEDVCKKPAAVPSNQVVVDAFLDFGDQELHRGQTGRGVTHLRAARSICDYPCAITSGIDARDVPLVGPKMATQVEQILNSDKLEDKAVCSEVSKLEVKKDTPSRSVREVHTITTRCPENQLVADELTKHEHVDTVENDESDGTCEQGSDGHECPDTPPGQVARSKATQNDGNKNTNDAHSAHVEMEPAESTGEGSAFDHAASRLSDAAELMTSGSVGKAIGCIREMVSTFVTDKVGLKLADDNATNDDEENDWPLRM